MLRAVREVLSPYLHRLAKPEPLVYTVAQAAAVLQVSPDTVSRLIRRNVLDRVPHIDGKQLIPRVSLDRLVATAVPVDESQDEVAQPSEISSQQARQRRRTSDP